MWDEMIADRNELPAWQWLNESDDLDRDILILFDDAKLERLVKIMGPRAKVRALKRGLRIAVRHYLAGRFVAATRRPGKAEWKRMVRFGEVAKSYAKALEGLMANGNADQRLIIDLANTPKDRIGPGELRFTQMFEQSGPRSPLRQLQQLVEATAASADRLAVEPFASENENATEEYQQIISWLATPDDKRRTEAFCLTEALKAFRRIWNMNSDKAFSGGKYYSDIGGFVGDAIQAAHLVMTTLDPLVTERRIATAIRDINKI